MKTLRFSSLLSVATALVLSACSAADAPTAPDARLVSSVSDAQLLRASDHGSPQMTLEAELKREKARIALAQKDSERAYDSLKVVWDQFLQQPKNVRDQSPFLVCDPLQYVADAKIVGPNGADISFGPHKLSIPKGALKTNVVITAEAPTTLYVMAKFSPHGVTFDPRYPPKLTLSYKHCQGQSPASKRIVYVDNQFRIIEYPLSKDEKDAGLSWAWIKHFSSYMIAY